ncbi:MAG: iron uptake system protein EfeO [Jatrophihabitans sp.]
MTANPARRRATTAAAAGVLVAALAGCSSSAGGDARHPAQAGGAGTANPRVVTVTVTASGGCTAGARSYPAGPLTFKIANEDATAVTEVELLAGERILGEKENVPPGFKGEFSVTVPAGDYALYCPGANPEKRPLKVAGPSARAADVTVAGLLKQATTGYAKYVDGQVAALGSAVRTLDAALHGTDLVTAQKAYIAARPFYERIEPVAESFVIGPDSLDADIDARAGDVPDAHWRGFHRIEKALFADRTLTGLATYGTRLVADVARLERLTAGLTYQPSELANGAQGLLDEVAARKITGEEERYSRIDLLDFANNVEAAEQAFAQLTPALTKIDAALGATISRRFATLDQLLGRYRTTTNPSGYRLYQQLTAADKRGFAAAVKAVQEPLSKVSSKVATG